MSISRKGAAALALPAVLLAAAAQAALPVHKLDNGTVSVSVTEAIGGRLLSLARAGQPNFLRVDTAAGDPAAKIDAASENVGYLGHEIWVGPQKQWWTHQQANPQRAADKANWPPDPYLSLAAYSLAKKTPLELVFDSPASPVSGLQLSKRYALVRGKPNSVKLDVSATNRRAQDVAWDIWFNTRTHADTHVYVPVAAPGDVRMQAIDPKDGIAALSYTLDQGIFSLDMPAPGAAGALARRGKLFLQPAHGWMAGFHGNQALIIQFAHQPRSAIHPDQGQIELYNDYQPSDLSKGLLEMEVHAPYRTLPPGKSMLATELWTILPYDGAATREAELDFLHRNAQTLGLQGL